MTDNGDQPELLRSRTITVWLPERDIEYLTEVAVELGLHNQNGSPNRNGALRAILAADRRLRARRSARKI